MLDVFETGQLCTKFHAVSISSPRLVHHCAFSERYYHIKLILWSPFTSANVRPFYISRAGHGDCRSHVSKGFIMCRRGYIGHIGRIGRIGRIGHIGRVLFCIGGERLLFHLAQAL